MLTDFLLHSDMKGGDIMAGVIMSRHDLFGGSRRRRLFILY
nr:MAG TPA: RNA polymerase L [Caudoviricetes sp.]